MTGINCMKILIIFGLVLSLGFCDDTYTVEYDSSIVADASSSDWEMSSTEGFLTDGWGGSGYFAAVQTGSEVCVWFTVYDDTETPGYDSVILNIGDFYKKVARGGSDSYYQTKEAGYYWASEICIPYDEIGITKGGSAYISGVYMDVFDDYGVTKVAWWPSYSGTGTFYSPERWGECVDDNNCPPDHNCVDYMCVEAAPECSKDDDCADDQTCAENECLDFVCYDYQEPKNHECVLLEGKCEEDADCEDENKECIDHECVASGCTIGGAIECCSNENCLDDTYCSDNECVAVPTGNCGYVESHAWHDYDCCDNDDCDSDESCMNHVCITTGAQPTCSGAINLQFVYKVSEKKLKALVSGIDHCEGKIIQIKEDNCNGEAVCFFESGDEGGYCEFTSPTEAGLHMYAACADLDGDGTTEFDQEGYLVEVEDGENGDEGCESVGCTVSSWNDCVCAQGQTSGTQIGTCADNCGTDLEFEQACTCGTGVTQEQADAQDAIEDAENAIEEAEDEGKDTSEAEGKLEQAQDAYDAGNYDLAEELAGEAEAIAKEEEPEKPFWEDSQFLTNAGLVILGLIIVILVMYILFRRPGTGQPIRPRIKREEKPPF